MKYKVKGRTFKVYVTLDITGEYPRVVPDKTDEEISKEPTKYKKEWAEFIRWDWKIANQMMRDATVLDPITGNRDLDYQILRELKLKRLLKDWSLEEDGKKIEIKRNENKGEMTEECYKEITSITPTIISTFLNKADLVLEFNVEEEKNFTKPSPQPLPQVETGKSEMKMSKS